MAMAHSAASKCVQKNGAGEFSRHPLDASSDTNLVNDTKYRATAKVGIRLIYTGSATMSNYQKHRASDYEQRRSQVRVPPRAPRKLCHPFLVLASGSPLRRPQSPTKADQLFNATCGCSKSFRMANLFVRLRRILRSALIHSPVDFVSPKQ